MPKFFNSDSKITPEAHKRHQAELKVMRETIDQNIHRLLANLNRRLSNHKDPTTNQNLINKLRGNVKEELMTYVRSFWDDGVPAVDCVDFAAHQSDDLLTNSEHQMKVSAKVNGFLRLVLDHLNNGKPSNGESLYDYTSAVLVAYWN